MTPEEIQQRVKKIRDNRKLGQLSSEDAVTLLAGFVWQSNENERLRKVLEDQEEDSGTLCEIIEKHEKREVEQDVEIQRLERKVMKGHRKGSMSCWDVSNLIDGWGAFCGLEWKLREDACSTCRKVHARRHP